MSPTERVVEPARTGARRIEEAHAADDFVLRQVAVPEQHEVNLVQQLANLRARGRRAGKDMRDEHAQLSDPCALDAVAVVVIVVAADERHRCDLAQRVDDRVAADVPRVHDVIDTLQRLHRLGTERPCVSEMTPIRSGRQMLLFLPRRV